jgi:hypothetical protein
MVKHGALSKLHVHHLLRSKDARVRRAAYTLLETSNPGLRRNSELFVEITRFIWDANPSYDIYREFTKRHFQLPYKVHELISARLEIEKQKNQRAAADHRTDNTCRYEGGLFKLLFRRRSSRGQIGR